MSETPEPSTTREVSPSSDEEESLLSLQIQAFLEASEDVDIDPGTVEELMRVLSQNEKDGESGVGGQDVDRNEKGGESDTEDLEWTKQEVKQMLHHLKERGMSSFIQEYVSQRNIAIPRLLEALGVYLCPELRNLRSQTLLYFLKVVMSHQLRMRDRLGQHSTIDDAVNLIQNAQRILILTGAGISVSCGIPDFRSHNGLYASLKARGEYDLDDPQQMFDILYFKENPSVFYSFASQIYPSNFTPSPCHQFIKCVENKGKLLRNYTQNIDTLETLAGVKRVLQCHGSFATASCVQCRRRVPGTEIEAQIMARKVPLCPVCNPPDARPKKRRQTRKQAKGDWDSDAEDESDVPEFPPGIMKPDITFFGEKLDDQFDRALAEDRDEVDLLIVIGTSLKVSPVAEILNHLPHSIPQILINKTPVRHINPDIVLLGNADDVILYICAELGWDLPSLNSNISHPGPTSNEDRLSRDNAKKRPLISAGGSTPPTRVGNSHVWLFDGAEGGQWLDNLQRRLADKLNSQSSGSPAPDNIALTSSADGCQNYLPREAKKQKLN